MTPFVVAGMQLTVPDRGLNISALARRIERMMRNFPWVQMILLSELCLTAQHTEHAVTLPGPEEDLLCELARRHGVWLVPGSVYERVGEHIFNTTIVIAPDGSLVGRYRKMFPFRPYEPGVEAGDQPFVFNIPNVGCFGVSICYDMWFPETSRQLVAMGAEVILHPSLTGTVDRSIELAIVRATAAQNQCYVLDVNGLGEGGVGLSIFVDPAGDILHLAGTAPEEIPIELDIDRVRRSREVGFRGLGQILKSFRDRNFDFEIYQQGARSTHLDMLGPLTVPTRGSRAGLEPRLVDEESCDEDNAE